MSKHSDGGNGGGMFGRVMVPPVQSEERRIEGAATSFRLPLLQALALAGSATILTLLVGLAVRDAGPLAFWLPVLIVSVTTFLWKLWRESRDDSATMLGLAAAVIFALLAGLVGLAAYRVAQMIAPQWWVAVLVVFFAYLTPLLALPFLQELALRSPFIEKAVGDIATGVALARWANPPAPQKEKLMLRMVPANVGAIKARPEPVIDSEPEPEDEAPPPRPQAAGYEYDPEYEVQTPSGAKRPLIDLVDFCQQAPIMGPAFEEWQTRRHWSHTRWGDVVDALSRVGVTTVRRAGVPVELLERDPDEAVRLLLASLVEPPTPPADGSSAVSTESAVE